MTGPAKTILCPKCSKVIALEADGTIPWHQHEFDPSRICPAAERGALIRSLLAANIKVEQAGEYLRLSNQLVVDPYTGRWFFGRWAAHIEGGMLPASLPLEARIRYLLKLLQAEENQALAACKEAVPA